MRLLALLAPRLGDGRVRQLHEISRDGGKRWTPIFDGLFTRRGS